MKLYRVTFIVQGEDGLNQAERYLNTDGRVVDANVVEQHDKFIEGVDPVPADYLEKKEQQ